MIKRDNLLKTKTTPGDKELAKQITVSKKTNNLKLCCFSLKVWPKQVLDMTTLKILDLGYNNIEEIPKEIKNFQELTELFLNNNPIQSVPIEISECWRLKVLDLSETQVKWLPREMAKLKFLSNINLNKCPLKGNLSQTYQMGINSLMSYFERKLDRSTYRELLVRYLKEWIYVDNTRDQIQEMIEVVFKSMKDLETKHLKRLLKNAQYLFPKHIEMVDAYDIKKKLVDSFNERTLDPNLTKASMLANSMTQLEQVLLKMKHTHISLFLICALLSCFISPVISQEESSTCRVDSDCDYLYICSQGECQHKSLLPITQQELIMTIVLMILSGLANAGGLGGGALLSPIILVGFNYDTTKSIMIVYSLVFGGALGNFINIAFLKNPLTDKSYINYDVTIVCMPLMFLGTSIGVLLNRMVPSLFTIMCLIALMVYTIRKLYNKAIKERQTEIERNLHIHLSQDHLDEKDKEIVAAIRTNSDVESMNQEFSKELTEILEEEKQIFPKEKISRIIALIASLMVLALIKGTDKVSSFIGLSYCGSGYWIVFGLTLFFCYLYYIWNKEYIQKIESLKLKEKYEAPDELKLTCVQFEEISRLSLIAGVLAGLLGIGGGMVMGPTLLFYGFTAQSLTATTGFFVVQTAFLSLFQALLYGNLTLLELTYFFGCSFFGSYVVSKFLIYFVEKQKRPSLILFTLVGVIGLSLIVMPIFAIWKSIGNPLQMLSFKSIC